MDPEVGVGLDRVNSSPSSVRWRLVSAASRKRISVLIRAGALGVKTAREGKSEGESAGG